jgi:hypothetical protein
VEIPRLLTIKVACDMIGVQRPAWRGPRRRPPPLRYISSVVHITTASKCAISGTRCRKSALPRNEPDHTIRSDKRA